MERVRVDELHFIARFEVIPSIFERGILCRVDAEPLNPPSIAEPDVLARRRTKHVPGGLYLFQYVNLYFDARNAMLYRRQDQWGTIGVVRVAPDVLDHPGAVIADRNAAAGAARFFASPRGLEALEEEDVYAVWWDHSRDARQKRMAEVLVPRCVEPAMLRGVYVRDETAAGTLRSILPDHPISINSALFFG
jgi:hypothetical protein